LRPIRSKNKGALIEGRVVAYDKSRDLALVQLPKLPPNVQSLAIASASVLPGHAVHSVGNPGSSDGLWVYTSGTVRQVYRKQWISGGGDLILKVDAQVVETQSPTNPGDSGGPLVNNNCELVGVTQGGSTSANLLSVFIDRSEAINFIEKATRGGKVKWVR